jgi:anti-sigma B factor antagonist
MQESSFTSTGATVVQPSGHINATNATKLRQQLAESLSSQQVSSLWIDMSHVESLDSAGLMVLVSTLTLAQRSDKQFKLFGVSPAVRIVFELTQLDRVFEILDVQSMQEAAVA